MLDLDHAIDLAVTESELELGIPAPIVASRSGLGAREMIVRQRQVGRRRGHPNMNRWTEEDLAFLRDNLGRMSPAELGRALGRSTNAIRIAQTRNGIPPASKKPHEITALAAARLIGVDVKLMIRLINMGEIPGRQLPMARKINVILRRDLLRWMMRPRSWVYFDRRRVSDPQLRAFLERRAERWGDEWLSSGQAARLVGHASDGKSILQRIYRGKLRAVRWANYRVLRSDVLKIRSAPGKGCKGMARIEWSREAHAFLLLAVAVGLRGRSIAALMGGPAYRSQWRMRMLLSQRAIPGLLVEYGLHGVEYRPERRDRAPWLVWADWHEVRRRFPTIERAARKLREGERLTPAELAVARDVLVSWARWLGRGNRAVLCIARTVETMGIKRPGAEARLRGAWAELRRAGINPFTARKARGSGG